MALCQEETEVLIIHENGSLHRLKKPHSASRQWKGTVGKPGLPPEPHNKPYLKLDSMPSGVYHACSRVALGTLSLNITFRREVKDRSPYTDATILTAGVENLNVYSEF